jgi:hypothetical protein
MWQARYGNCHMKKVASLPHPVLSTLAKFPHYTKSNNNKNCKSIKIILHGTYLFMSENQQHWLL